MANPKMKYIGDAAMKRLLSRYDCPYPLHVVRMRFWGEIVSPAWNVSPIQTIESLWPEGLPAFESEREATRFFQVLLGLWHNMAKYQDGKPPLKLTPVGPMQGRDDVRKAANLRVEELHDGFLQGFTGGQESIDVPAGVGDILARIEKGIELLATTRNTFAEPPGPDDDAMVAAFIESFGEIDRSVQGDLNALAATVKEWRKDAIAGGQGGFRSASDRNAR